VPADGFPIEWLSIGGLRGKGVATLLAAPFKLAQALWQALAIMRKHRPAVVVGLGGFVTGPGGVAAWLTRRPLIIHEQNAIAGFTNRCLARIAREVLEAFPGSFPGRSAVRAIGNPVRQDILAAATPAERFGTRSGVLRLLVVGGSQGAVRLNTIVPAAIAQAATNGTACEVTHQSGERWLDGAREAYRKANVSATVVPFLDDMAAAYASADLVVCRSGALTISELAAVGVGAILVPFPAAVDDHQTRNAEFLVRAGGAVLIPERELTTERLATELARLARDRDLLAQMAASSRAVARPNATTDLAAVCRAYLGGAA
jgi:UDP-N-acetylglucosamine--N-acetylmuramyl-(pentapeptide) pyrophosphoryl-undecaprenol N-acetylglucosamine transferase